MLIHITSLHYIHSVWACLEYLIVSDEVLIAILYNVLQDEIVQLKSVIHQEHGTAQPGVYLLYYAYICNT